MNRSPLGQRLQLNAGASGVGGTRREGVVVDAPERRGCLRRGIQRNGSTLAKDREADRAQVVQAQNVVGVGVGVKDSVHAGEAVLERLFAEVRAGVDDHHPLPPAVLARL